MNDQYLVPANSKKSMLILSIFRPKDLILAIIGISLTLLLAIIIGTDTMTEILIIIAPGLISAALVVPIPNYHNFLQLITEIFHYFINRKTYLWKGWCFTIDEGNKE